MEADQRNQPQSTYHAYLIRLRRNGTPPVWRVSLHDVHSDLQLQFKQVTELVEFLLTKFEQHIQLIRIILEIFLKLAK